MLAKDPGLQAKNRQIFSFPGPVFWCLFFLRGKKQKVQTTSVGFSQFNFWKDVLSALSASHGGNLTKPSVDTSSSMPTFVSSHPRKGFEDSLEMLLVHKNDCMNVT